MKTTLSEDRSHRISSLTQLEPSPDRELWLVSVQLTSGGVGGTTLPEQVQRTTDRLSNPGVLDLFASRLADLGWNPAHDYLYTRHFAPRAEMLTFRVTPDFPAITERRLRDAGFPIERFSHLSYVLHTAGIPPDPPPTELQGLCSP